MSAGKGDKRRPGLLRAYEEGFERIWGKREKAKEQSKPSEKPIKKP